MGDLGADLEDKREGRRGRSRSRRRGHGEERKGDRKKGTRREKEGIIYIYY